MSSDEKKPLRHTCMGCPNLRKHPDPHPPVCAHPNFSGEGAPGLGMSRNCETLPSPAWCPLPLRMESVCEHGDHPAPAGQRFCSLACQQCDSTDHEGDGCANVCGRNTVKTCEGCRRKGERITVSNKQPACLHPARQTQIATGVSGVLPEDGTRPTWCPGFEKRAPDGTLINDEGFIVEQGHPQQGTLWSSCEGAVAARVTCEGCPHVKMDNYPDNGQPRPLCHHPTQTPNGRQGRVATRPDGKPPEWCPLNSGCSKCGRELNAWSEPACVGCGKVPELCPCPLLVRYDTQRLPGLREQGRDVPNLKALGDQDLRLGAGLEPLHTPPCLELHRITWMGPGALVIEKARVLAQTPAGVILAESFPGDDVTLVRHDSPWAKCFQEHEALIVAFAAVAWTEAPGRGKEDLEALVNALHLRGWKFTGEVWETFMPRAMGPTRYFLEGGHIDYEKSQATAMAPTPGPLDYDFTALTHGGRVAVEDWEALGGLVLDSVRHVARIESVLPRRTRGFPPEGTFDDADAQLLHAVLLHAKAKGDPRAAGWLERLYHGLPHLKPR